METMVTGGAENVEFALRSGARLFRAGMPEAGRVDGAVGSYGPELAFHLVAQMNARKRPTSRDNDHPRSNPFLKLPAQQRRP
jgi:hypothetical protein